MAKISKSQMVYISEAKVRKELEKRNLTTKQASLQMGHNAGYLTHKFATGYFSITDTLLFDSLFNIPVDSYGRPAEEEEEDEQEEQTTPQIVVNPVVDVKIDYDKLSDVIYRAVYAASYEAFKKALENDTTNTTTTTNE